MTQALPLFAFLKRWAHQQVIRGLGGPLLSRAPLLSPVVHHGVCNAPPATVQPQIASWRKIRARAKARSGTESDIGFAVSSVYHCGPEEGICTQIPTSVATNARQEDLSV